MNANDLYEQRLQRFDDVMIRRIPDRVPIIPNMNTWMYHLAGVSVKTAFTEDPNEIFRAAKHLNDTLPLDGLVSTSNTIPINLAKKIGDGIYTFSENGVQIKGSGGHLMEPQEYPLLAQDPMKFFANVLIPRKFEIFNTPSIEKKVDIIKQAYKDNLEYIKYNSGVNARIEKELGLPIIVRGTNFLAPDVVLDYLRDFVGISLDVRRHSDELLEACLSLYDYIIGMFDDTATPPNRKLLFSPLHLPTYLRPKDFQKLYLPFMKKYLEEMAVKRGYSCYFFMENDWMPYLDLLREELPKDAKVVGLFEKGDLKIIKEKVGKEMVIMGGMPVELLALGTKEQVIDKCKELLDTLAPGGNYIFSTDKSMMTLSDGTPENTIAACEYIAAHGQY